MMWPFKTKEIDFPLNISITTSQISIDISEIGYISNNTKINCKIYSNPLISVLSGNNYYELKDIQLLNFRNRKVETTEQFCAQGYFKGNSLNEINLELPIIDLISNIQDNKTIFILRANVSDSKSKKQPVEIRLNFSEIYERIKSIEKVIRPNTAELEYTEEKKIRLKFNPELEVKGISLIKGISYKIKFPGGFIEENKGYLSFGALKGFEINVINENKLKNFKENSLEFNIEITTDIQTHIINFSIPTIELKKYYFMKKNPFEFKEEDLIAIRVSYQTDDKRNVKREITTKVIYGSLFRASVHFTLNHVVRGHSLGDWENTDLAYIIPFKELKEKNKESFCGGTSVDLFFVGYVKLPSSTIILKRNTSESWESFSNRINEILILEGFKVMQGGDYNWGNMTGIEESNLIKKITNNTWFTYKPHTYSEFGNAENNSLKTISPGKPKEEESNIFRTNLIRLFERDFPQILERFGKQLKAWDSYWRKKGY